LDTCQLTGVIVETEAYYGLRDPASRAAQGRKTYNAPMWEVPGTIFIYNVHRYWMFNVVAHPPHAIGAVLIRAVQPIDGIDIMMQNRPVDNMIALTNGPGKLTIAFQIDKRFNHQAVTSVENVIYIVPSRRVDAISCSHRIGVRQDLMKKLRFFIQDNPYVSRSYR
jgi:DNA-3-methyladenine glycosylase